MLGRVGCPTNEGRGKKEERGECRVGLTCHVDASHQLLMVILIPFDHFNGLSHNRC